jgi:hypothetical protein
MSFEDAIIDYLAQPENLPIAIEVSEYIKKLKENLHRQFWQEFNNQMKQIILSSEFSESWEFAPFPIRRLKKEYERCSIRPKNPDDKKTPALQVMFCHGYRSNYYQFYRGVSWNDDIKEFEHPLLDKLKAQLIERDLVNDDWRWAGWNWYPYRAQGEKFMLKMYHEPEEMVAELRDDIWKLFIDFRPLLEEINKEVGI